MMQSNGLHFQHLQGPLMHWPWYLCNYVEDGQFKLSCAQRLVISVLWMDEIRGAELRLGQATQIGNATVFPYP
jgi:hypothetical protein